MLSAAAQRIEPPPRLPRHRVRNAALGVLAVAGVIGIAGALLTRWRVMNATYIRECEERQTVPQASPRSSSTSATSATSATGPVSASGLPSSHQAEQTRNALRTGMGRQKPRQPHP
jgi:hypothetical protein